MSTVIQATDVWKQYRLGVIGHGTLSQDLQAWWAKIRKREDPNSRIGKPVWNKHAANVEGDYFWALNSIDLSLSSGNVLGIIGKNGSGKSTLLKILSRVTAPTKGVIHIKGRLASLLEVGTGFHPELTGRENIYLNAAILGMSKHDVKRRLDEIIDFSGVEAFIDTPVKRYSSGMYVRLAFAVAAHLEAEILVIDEVLAVGDTEFQKKCLGKMESISSDGRTILFVSHNLTAVKSLCQKGIVLSEGSMTFVGSAEDAVEHYATTGLSRQTVWNWENSTNPPGNEFLSLISAEITPLEGKRIDTESGIVFQCSFSNLWEHISLDLTLHFLTNENFLLFEAEMPIHTKKDSRRGMYTVRCVVPPQILNSGHYNINLHFRESGCHILLRLEDLFTFTVETPDLRSFPNFRSQQGAFIQSMEWSCDVE